MRATRSGRRLALGLLLAGGATAAIAAPTLLVSGRWDNTILVIDLARAMEPGNDGTPNAIVNRVRVTPDIAPNTPASGQPGSGMLWVVDVAERKVMGRVSGVGNETYLLALLP